VIVIKYLGSVTPFPWVRIFGAMLIDTPSHSMLKTTVIAIGTINRQRHHGCRRSIVHLVVLVMSGLSAKLANSIERSNTLPKTYAPLNIEAVRNADAARLKGRKRIRAGNESGLKVSTQQPKRVSTDE
jgi:hypothetical protein